MAGNYQLKYLMEVQYRVFKAISKALLQLFVTLGQGIVCKNSSFISKPSNLTDIEVWGSNTEHSDISNFEAVLAAEAMDSKPT